MTWRDAAAPLRNRTFAWYFASRTADTLGTMMAGVALAFAVLDLDGSAAALGQVLAANTIPQVVFLLYGGVLADRLPRTLVLQVSNLVAAASQGVLAFLVITGRAELWQFMLLAAVNGTADAANFPAMAGMVPQLVPRSQLQPANALLSLSRSGLRIVGPTISAGLVVTVGPGWGLAVNAGMWVLSTVLLLGVAVPPKPPREHDTSTLHELREGWRLFSSTTWLWTVVLAFSVVNALVSGAWFTLGPARAQDTIGAQGWGLLLSAESVGLVVTGLVLLRFRLRRPLLVGMLGFSFYGVPVAVLGLRPDLGLLLILAFVAGVGAELFAMGWDLAMQENVEHDMLARAYSYDAVGSFAAMPVGQLLLGPLGDRYGLAPVLVASGVAMVAVCLLTLLSRSVRTMDRQPVAGEPVTSG